MTIFFTILISISIVIVLFISIEYGLYSNFITNSLNNIAGEADCWHISFNDLKDLYYENTADADLYIGTTGAIRVKGMPFNYFGIQDDICIIDGEYYIPITFCNYIQYKNFINERKKEIINNSYNIKKYTKNHGK